MTETTEPMDIAKALKRAFSLGQTYWQQADSDSMSQNRKSDETKRKFDELLESTVAALASSTQPSAVVQPVAGRDELQVALRTGLAEVYDCVTRESAENAIEYMASYNGRGREIDAQAMLVTTPQSATQADSHDYTVHSCSYFCENPECIKQQRDEMRDKAIQLAKPLTTHEIEDLWDAQLFHITDLSMAIDFVRDVEAAHNIKLKASHPTTRR